MDGECREDQQDGDPHDEVAEVFDGLVEIRIRDRLAKTLGDLPELGHRAGGLDDGGRRARDHAGTHKDDRMARVAIGLFFYGKGFTGKGRLIDEEILGGDELGIRGDDIARGKENDIAGHKQGKVYFLAYAIAQNGRGCCNAGGEPGNRLFRAVGIGKIKNGGKKDHRKNDDGIGAFAKKEGYDRRDDQYEQERAVEFFDERNDGAKAFFLVDGIGPMSKKPLAGFDGGKADGWNG